MIAYKIKGLSILSALVGLVFLSVTLPFLTQQENLLKQKTIQTIQLDQVMLVAQNLAEKIVAMPQNFQTNEDYLVTNFTFNATAIDCFVSECSHSDVAQYDLNHSILNLRDLGFTNTSIRISCLDCTNTWSIYSLVIQTNSARRYTFNHKFIW